MSATLVLHTEAQPDVCIALDRPLAWELRRVCLEQFDRAIHGLTRHPDPDAGVHEARKAMKRLRALLRLVRDELGYFAYRQENVVLRDVARRISAARDPKVLMSALNGLGADFPDVSAEVHLAPRAVLEADHRRARRETFDDRGLMSGLVTTLRCSRRRFAARPVGTTATDDRRTPIRDDFSAVAGGIRRVYRRGRRAMQSVLKHRTDERLHEWRKRAKYLRYQMESLQPIHPAYLDDLAGGLNDLGELLGTDHDFAVLEGMVAERPAMTDGGVRRRVLLALIARRRLELQQPAIELGRGLYAVEPDAFVDRIGVLWAAARGAARD